MVDVLSPLLATPSYTTAAGQPLSFAPEHQFSVTASYALPLPETLGRVDDEPIIRMLVVEVVEGLGYEVLDASDGPGAMKMIEAKRDIDLLITNVGLPGGMNGRQIADAACSQRPDIKVIFITGYAENAVVGNG